MSNETTVMLPEEQEMFRLLNSVSNLPQWQKFYQTISTFAGGKPKVADGITYLFAAAIPTELHPDYHAAAYDLVPAWIQAIADNNVGETAVQIWKELMATPREGMPQEVAGRITWLSVDADGLYQPAVDLLSRLWSVHGNELLDTLQNGDLRGEDLVLSYQQCRGDTLTFLAGIRNGTACQLLEIQRQTARYFPKRTAE